MWVYDAQTARLTEVVIADVDDATVRSERLFQAQAMVHAPFLRNDDVVAAGWFGDAALSVFSFDGRRRSDIPVDQPFPESEIPQFTPRLMMNNAFAAASPSRTGIVVAYRNVSRIDFYTMHGRRYGSIEGPRSTKPSFRIGRSGDNALMDSLHVAAYKSVDATDEHVFALFDGYQKHIVEKPRRVHVFRWDGTFVTELVLDQGADRVAVSPGGCVLYGARSDPEPAIIEWALGPMEEWKVGDRN